MPPIWKEIQNRSYKSINFDRNWISLNSSIWWRLWFFDPCILDSINVRNVFECTQDFWHNEIVSACIIDCLLKIDDLYRRVVFIDKMTHSVVSQTYRFSSHIHTICLISHNLVIMFFLLNWGQVILIGSSYFDRVSCTLMNKNISQSK